MNPIKKILVSYRKTRGIYDEINKVYRPKHIYDPEKKNEVRFERRMKQLGTYDFDESDEPPIEALTQNRAKLMQKMLTDMRNNNRLSRPPMPKELKAEYIKRCKEFSLWSANKWRHMRHQEMKVLRNSGEMCKAVSLLPFELAAEIIDVDNLNIPIKRNTHEVSEQTRHEDLSEGNEINEYHHNFLYTPQYLRIYPDDLNIRTRVVLNLKAYIDEGLKKSLDSSSSTMPSEDRGDRED